VLLFLKLFVIGSIDILLLCVYFGFFFSFLLYIYLLPLQAGAYPSPLNYHGFPKSCCTSVNEVICHGIPDDRKLEDGDLINIDITTYLNGYHGDCSEMFVAGEASPEAKALVQATYDCWILACQYVQPGRAYKDLGALMEDWVVPRGFSSVRNFCGHGVGSVFHTTPNILHYRNNEPNGQMAEGHVSFNPDEVVWC
jgi:methionyl aminopeptidase